MLIYNLNKNGTYDIFASHENVECIRIPKEHNGKKITSIGNNGFSTCPYITSVTIPNSVTSIGDSAFEGCRKLTSVKIPNSVTSIGYAAFCLCRGITSIKIPNSVTSIGNCIFAYCDGLTSVTIGKGVTSIGSHAFEGCSKLTSINYKGTVDKWNSISKGTDWQYNVPASVVHCSDGDVDI